LRERRGDVVEAALVTLVDAPLVSVATVVRLVEAWRPQRPLIVRPARAAEHGHPVLFDRRLFDELRAADPARGAKTVVRAHDADIVNLPIDDPGAFLDIDTEQEYREVLRARQR
jgi:molybdenum cofactor cytidylyltransferase